MQNDDALVERIAMTICRGGGTGLCVGFCHSKRCPDAIAQYRVTARAVLAILPQVTGTPEVMEVDRIAAAKVHPGSHNSALILDGERDGTDIVRAAMFGRAAGFAAGAVEGAKAMHEEAVRQLTLRQDLFGGEPMTLNEASIAQHMLHAIAALDPAQIAGGGE